MKNVVTPTGLPYINSTDSNHAPECAGESCNLGAMVCPCICHERQRTMKIPITKELDRTDIALARAKKWIRDHCVEESCKKDQDPDCFSCQALRFLDSLE